MTVEQRSAVTLSDVAERAGVSLATASRVLNGSVRQVQDRYRMLVLQAATELGYTTNHLAQAVAKGRSSTIGLLVNDIHDPYFSALAAGMIAAADQHRHVVTIAVTDSDPERELEVVRTFRGLRSRAIVLAGSRTISDPVQAKLGAELQVFTTNGGKVVIIGRHELPFSTVCFAGNQAATALAATLVNLGYRNFAVLAGPKQLVTAHDRVAGFTEELQRQGLSPRVLVHCEFGREGGYSAALEIDLSGIDLLWAVNDVMAIGAMAGLRKRGIRLPVEIAVAGFDDISTVADITPGLTTVRLPLETAGRSAIDLVFNQGSEEVVTLEHRIIIRDSTPGLARVC